MRALGARGIILPNRYQDVSRARKIHAKGPKRSSPINPKLRVCEAYGVPPYNRTGWTDEAQVAEARREHPVLHHRVLPAPVWRVTAPHCGMPWLEAACKQRKKHGIQAVCVCGRVSEGPGWGWPTSSLSSCGMCPDPSSSAYCPHDGCHCLSHLGQGPGRGRDRLGSRRYRAPPSLSVWRRSRSTYAARGRGRARRVRWAR